MRLWLRRWIWKFKGVTVWHYCNIDPSAEIGEGTSIGSYTEIGPNVKIGKNVRIGAKCFIPEGVEIRDNAWIGPCCVFSNDLYPPSSKTAWKRTVIDEKAALGAGVKVLPGRYVPKGAMIGMGSMVVDRLEYEDSIYMGFKAKKHRDYVRRQHVGHNLRQFRF